MRRFFTHPVVMLSMVVVIATILLMGSKKTSWYSWFWLRSTTKNISVSSQEYVRKNVITDIVFDVISAHSALAWSVVIDPTLWPVSSMWWVPGYISAAQRILLIDVVSYLENAKNKDAALDSLLWQMDYYRNQWWDIASQLESTIQEKSLDMNACERKKTGWDREFYQWLRDSDQNTMLRWLEDAKAWGACQASLRIDVNANKVLLQRVGDIRSTLQNVASLLQQNRTTIIANFPLFKDTNLEKLLSLRNELRAKSPGTN
jgi:hypothetical protein